MSRDSSGTYTAPSNSVNPAVEGTAIDETDFNALINDIEAGLTDSLDRTGKGKVTAHIDFDEVTVTNPASNVGRLYVKDVSGITSLFFRDSAGSDKNLLEAAGRERLVGDRTYYVRTDGNDANTGLADTAGAAFLTIQKAIDVALGLDLNGRTVFVIVRAGTYTAGISMLRPLVGGAGSQLVVIGDTTTPANVIISITGSNSAVSVQNGAQIYVEGFRVASTAGFGVLASGPGTRVTLGNMDFGAVGQSHIIAQYYGFVQSAGRSHTISGNPGVAHWQIQNGGAGQIVSNTITMSGTRNFPSQFALIQTLGVCVCNANTFSGTATGQRYYADLNSVIQTFGGGATYLPGNSSGSTASGGQYT